MNILIKKIFVFQAFCLTLAEKNLQNDDRRKRSISTILIFRILPDESQTFKTTLNTQIKAILIFYTTNQISNIFVHIIWKYMASSSQQLYYIALKTLHILV